MEIVWHQLKINTLLCELNENIWSHMSHLKYLTWSKFELKRPRLSAPVGFVLVHQFSIRIDLFTCRHWFLGGETVQVRPCLNSTSPLYSFFQLDITPVICLVDICIRTNWGWGMDVFRKCSSNPPATGGRGRHSCSCLHLLETQTATSRALRHHFTDKVPWTHGHYTLHCNQTPRSRQRSCTFPSLNPVNFQEPFSILRFFQQI